MNLFDVKASFSLNAGKKKKKTYPNMGKEWVTVTFVAKSYYRRERSPTLQKDKRGRYI